MVLIALNPYRPLTVTIATNMETIRGMLTIATNAPMIRAKPPANSRNVTAQAVKSWRGTPICCRAPALLLLHGFPTSSHMFRDLIPMLADRLHLIAPDLPGFGQSDMPDRSRFSYTFDNIAKVIERFTEVIGLSRFAIYVFDYGAPTGFRLAVSHPERITAIISQNGNT